MLPARKGSNIPRMVLFIALLGLLDVDVDNVDFFGNPTTTASLDIVEDDVDDEDRRANTSDAGKNTLQHQSYRK